MVWSLQFSALVELFVVLFQVMGVLALCISRLHVSELWGERARFGVLIALIGLGVAGALCGRQDSEFSLFAGLTMGGLMIFMCLGGGHMESDESVGLRVEAELPPAQ